MNLVLLFIAVIFVGVVVWLGLSLHRIYRSKSDVLKADKQLAQYRGLQSKAMDAAESILRQEQVTISRKIYQNAIKEYNESLKKPQNRFLAGILKYPAVMEEARN